MAIEEAQDFKKLPFNDLLEKIYTQELTMNEDDELPYKVKNVFKSKKGEVSSSSNEDSDIEDYDPLHMVYSGS